LEILELGNCRVLLLFGSLRSEVSCGVLKADLGGVISPPRLAIRRVNDVLKCGGTLPNHEMYNEPAVY
jgi:hypothetical protein